MTADYHSYLELIAVGAGALSGVLHAIHRRFDLVGSLIIGMCTGVGGGLLRDVILASGIPIVLHRSSYILTALLCAVIGMFFAGLIRKLRPALWSIDATALGLFAVVGTRRAIDLGLDWTPCILLGVITAVGGGIIRDVLCRETANILIPGQPYATAAGLGALTYTVSRAGFSLPHWSSEILAILATFGLRAFAVWRGWTVPEPRDVLERITRKKQ